MDPASTGTDADSASTRQMRGAAILIPLSTLSLMALIALLSLIPGTPTEGDSALVWAVARVSPGVQNLGHVILYGLLAALWMRTFHGWGISRTGAASLVIATGFGILLELGQLQVPGRFGSLYDALLNALGAGLGVWVMSRLSSRKQKG